MQLFFKRLTLFCVMAMTVGSSLPANDRPYLSLAKNMGKKVAKYTLYTAVGAVVAWRIWPLIFGVGTGTPQLPEHPTLDMSMFGRGILEKMRYDDNFKPNAWGTQATYELSKKMGADAQKVLGYNTYPLIGALKENLQDTKKAILITAEGWPDTPYLWSRNVGLTGKLQCYRMIVSANFRDSGFSFCNGFLPLVATLRFFNLGGHGDQRTLMHTVTQVYKAYPDAPLKLYGYSRGGGATMRLLHALHEYDTYASWWKALDCTKDVVAKILANVQKGGVVLAKPAVNRRAILKHQLGGLGGSLALVGLTVATDYHLWNAEAIDLLEQLVAKKYDLSFVTTYCASEDLVLGQSQDDRLKAIAQTFVDGAGIETKQPQVKAGLGRFVVDSNGGHNDNAYVEQQEIFKHALV